MECNSSIIIASSPSHNNPQLSKSKMNKMSNSPNKCKNALPMVTPVMRGGRRYVFLLIYNY